MAYWQELTGALGGGWNRFWFTPRDPRATSVLRILVGIAAFYYVASFTPDLVRWFGSHGLLPADTVARLTTEPGTEGVTIIGRWSYLDHVHDPSDLWLLHSAALGVLALYIVGFLSRITSVLSAVIVLSYLHRAPMLAGQFEAVLTLLLIYLCLAPTGAYFSVDAWWRRRTDSADASSTEPAPSILANVSIRLIQVHVAALYLLAGLSMLGGTGGTEYDPTWWSGTAMWWLITRSESRLVDLTFLNGSTSTYVVNLWTHLVVALNLAFGVLVWNRLARPLLLGATCVSWLLLAIVTGWVSYAVIMVIAGVAYVSPQRLARWTGAAAA